MNFLRRLWYAVRLLRRAGGVGGARKLAESAPKYLALYRRLLADPRVPKSAKAVIVGSGLFAASPLNLPGFIPVVGVLDDIGIMVLAHGYFMRQIPADVLAEHRAAVGIEEDLGEPKAP